MCAEVGHKEEIIAGRLNTKWFLNPTKSCIGCKILSKKTELNVFV